MTNILSGKHRSMVFMWHTDDHVSNGFSVGCWEDETSISYEFWTQFMDLKQNWNIDHTDYYRLRMAFMW